MLNFYTAKQGEKLEQRVVTLEESGGGGGSSIPELEIDCTGVTFETKQIETPVIMTGLDYLEVPDSSSAPIFEAIANNIDWTKPRYRVILKNITVVNHMSSNFKIDSYGLDCDITILKSADGQDEIIALQLSGGRNTVLIADNMPAMYPTGISFYSNRDHSQGMLYISLQILGM